jgi:hypothetical protein
MTADLDDESIRTILHDEFKRGDNAALLRALVICAQHHWPIPEWAGMALEKAYRLAEQGAIKSWDQIFGSPLPKGRQQRGLQTKSRRFEVWCRIEDLQNEGNAIDNDLFERVGKELGIGGKTTVADLYAEVERILRPIRDAIIADKEG